MQGWVRVSLLFLASILSSLNGSVFSTETTNPSDYQRTQEIVNLMRDNKMNTAVEKVDLSLAPTVRNLDPHTKQLFAYLFNERGVLTADQKNLSSALPYLELAVELDPQKDLYQKNLSQILIGVGQQEYLSGDFSDAEKYTAEALRYDAKNVMAMALLSDIYYFSQKTLEAKKILQQANEIAPNSEEIQKRLKKISEEEQLEQNLKLAETEIFDIKFEKSTLAYNITDLKQTLRKAYREIGQNLNYFPKRTLPVILYPEEDYRQLRELPEWSSGAYDGKIRIPIPDSIQPNRLKQIIWHEYTHAVVRDLTSGNCPVWLNEGLADYHGHLYIPLDWETLRRAYPAKQLLSFQQISQHFQSFSNPTQVRLAYDQSYSIVQFIIDRWGMYKIRHLLQACQENPSLEELLRSQLHIKVEAFEKEWLKYLKRKLYL